MSGTFWSRKPSARSALRASTAQTRCTWSHLIERTTPSRRQQIETMQLGMLRKSSPTLWSSSRSSGKMSGLSSSLKSSRRSTRGSRAMRSQHSCLSLRRCVSFGSSNSPHRLRMPSGWLTRLSCLTSVWKSYKSSLMPKRTTWISSRRRARRQKNWLA